MMITLFALSLAAIAGGSGNLSNQTAPNNMTGGSGNLSTQPNANMTQLDNVTKMNCSIIGMVCEVGSTCSNGLVCGVGTDCQNGNTCDPVNCTAKNSACCTASKEPGCDETTNSAVAFCVGQMLPSCTAETGSWDLLCVELAQDYCNLICNKETTGSPTDGPPTIRPTRYPTPPTTPSPTPCFGSDDSSWTSKSNNKCEQYYSNNKDCDLTEDENGQEIILNGNSCNYCYCVDGALEGKKADTDGTGKKAGDACYEACDMCTDVDRIPCTLRRSARSSTRDD